MDLTTYMNSLWPIEKERQINLAKLNKFFETDDVLFMAQKCQARALCFK
jgi:hypothetical protein